MHVTIALRWETIIQLCQNLQLGAYFDDCTVICCSLYGGSVGLGLGRWYGPTDNSGRSLYGWAMGITRKFVVSYYSSQMVACVVDRARVTWSVVFRSEVFVVRLYWSVVVCRSCSGREETSQVAHGVHQQTDLRARETIPLPEVPHPGRPRRDCSGTGAQQRTGDQSSM